MFGKVLLYFSTSGILDLFPFFPILGFEINKASLVISDNHLSSSVRKFSLQPRLINHSFNLSKCLLSSDISEQIFFNRSSWQNGIHDFGCAEVGS